MKIALIIFRIGPSHGSLLQTYALHKVLMQLGHDVAIIDRQPFTTTIENIKSNLARILYKMIGVYNGPIFYKGGYSNTSMQELNLFVNRYLRPHTRTIFSDKEVRDICKDNYDCYIVGSDQTWRPKFVYDIYYYFLSFVPEKCNAKRIAYAPSFGTGIWEYDDIQTDICSSLAKRFNAISVREEEGGELCKTYLGVKPEIVLDPTMLLSKDDYLELIDSPNENCVDKLAYSILDDSSFARTTLDYISHLYGLQKHQINSKTINRVRKEDYIEPSISDWLGGIKNAKFVITDSFHATVFSIIFNIPFITIINKERGSSRIFSLLSRLGLEYRMITENAELADDLFNIEINWDAVNNKLDKLRSSSLTFITNNIN